MNIDEIINQLKDAKIPDLSNPDDHESSETFDENIIINLPNETGIGCTFEWGYSRKKGMKGDGYLTPDDSDTLTLDYFHINSLEFLDSDGNAEDITNSPLKAFIRNVLIDKLNMDDVDWNKVYGPIIAYTEKRILKFKDFVNETGYNDRYKGLSSNTNLDDPNVYYEVTEPFDLYIITGFEPSNSYFGSSQIFKPVYKKITTKKGDKIINLFGGTFYRALGDKRKHHELPHCQMTIREFSAFEKQPALYQKYPMEKLKEIEAEE